MRRVRAHVDRFLSAAADLDRGHDDAAAHLPEMRREFAQHTDTRMNGATFTCACCGRSFKRNWSDEEAAAELGQRFPGFEPDDCALVCDDCYKALLRRMRWADA
jgi:hypothetical protein